MNKRSAEGRNTSSSPSDPLRWGTVRHLQKTFNPIGTVLRVSSNSEKVLEAAEESFAPYGVLKDSIPSDFTIDLCSDSAHQQQGAFPPASYRALGHLFHVSCGEGSFAVADLNLRRAFGFVAEEILEDRSFFRNVFLECLFYVMAVHSRFTPVHAAAVVHQKQGILIWGEAGAGKSTLAYSCAKAGFQLVSDDVVHLQTDPASDQLIGWGRPWQIRLLPDAADIFPELVDEVPRLRSDHQWYLEVDLRKRLPSSPLVSCRPSVVLFLCRNATARGRLDPIDWQQALDILKKDIYLTEESVLERHYSTLRKLVRLNAYRLSYSGPPSLAVEILRKSLLDIGGG
jgi:hypothetical protein